MQSHNLRWSVFLTILTFGILLMAILSEDPIRAGYITDKDYDPAHWVYTGKGGYMATESWDVSISSCQPGYQSGDCGWGHYGVSESTYDSSQIGDYIRFSDPSPVGDLIIRAILVVLGMVVLAFTYIQIDMLRDKLVNSLPLDMLVVLLLTLCLVMGEVMIFLGAKGPTGLIG